MKRTPIKRTSSLKARPSKRLEPEWRGIRALKRDDPDPPGEPRRYLNAEGYTRLRWKIAPGQHLERYLRDEDGKLVRDRPSEILYVDYELAKTMYEDGWTLPRIASELCTDHGTLSRGLRKLGVQMRTTADYHVPLDLDEAERRYHKEQIGIADLARDLGVSEQRLGDGFRKRKVSRRVGTNGKHKDGPSYYTEFKEMRPVILERAGDLCEIRSQRCIGQASVVHHRKRRAQGGENSEANLCASCDPCHRYLHHHPYEAYANGWMVESWRDPSEVPLRTAEAIA